MRFVDTNILLYSISTDPSEERKATIAEKLLQARDLALSVQVLQEFYVQATRPGKPGALTHREAIDFIASWKRFPVQEMTFALMDSALAAKDRWMLSYWDAAVVESARAAGCGELLSEDLSDGQDYGGVRVIDPFR
jgi:predicted nucleic acid-binding protein